ncbi:MAG TPA: AAA family ATPase [Gaiellaceae bacterium]|nr:AAA family ATPase [Gaiellaceae bacterium]
MQLVGRSRELTRIESLAEEARNGRTRALLVTGEAGIGKTSLLEAAADGAQEFRALRARGIQSEYDLPYASLLELLQPLLGRLDALPAAQRRALCGALGLGPANGGALAVAGAAATLLAAAAAERPLLALVDDVQWVDAASAGVFAFAARRLHDVPLLTVMSLREPLLAPVELDGLERLRLAPLDQQAATELLAAGGLEPSLQAAVSEQAAGNPLVLVELARAGRAAGIEAEELAERLFGARVRVLNSAARAALLAISLSTACDRTVAATIAGGEALQPLEELSLVVTRGRRVEPSHPLLRSFVLGLSDGPEQLAAHAALAAALPDGDDRTRHRALAQTGPDAALAAEVESLGVRGGNGFAVWALERSAELSPPGPERTRRRLAAARAAFAARDIAAAEHLVAEFRREGANGLGVDAAELEASILLADGSLVPGAERLQRAAGDIEQSAPARAAKLLAAAVTPLLYAGRLDDAERVAVHARRLAGSRDPVARLHAETAYADVCVGLGRWDEGRKTHRAAAAEADRSQLIRDDPDATLWLIEALHSGGLDDRARELALAAASHARQTGSVGSLTGALQMLFSIEFVCGRIGPATAAATEELEVAAGFGRLMDHKEALGHLAWGAAHSGDEVACRELVTKRYELSERLGDDALLHPSLGVLELGLGRADAAVSTLQRTLRTSALRGYRPEAEVWIVTGELVEALLLAGRRAEASDLLETFAAGARSIGRPHALSIAERCRGLLAEPDAFDTAFEAALAYDQEEPRPLERARTILCWGMRLRRSKRRTEARARLSEAQEELDRLGSELWSARARAELAASGQRLRRRDAPGGGELTARERQVAELVAEGLSNRAVAERLFLSTNTIETHLRHIFQKLGVQSRTELVRRLSAEASSSR